MTTENLKAVLNEEEIGRVSHVKMIAEGAKSENPKTFSGCIVSFFYHTVLEILSIIARLADEVVRLEKWKTRQRKGRDLFWKKQLICLNQMEFFWKSKCNIQSDRISELEAEVAELRGIKEDMENHELEDEEIINKLESKLKAWEDAPRVEVEIETRWHPHEPYLCNCPDNVEAGTYHLKPKEADDAQGN